MQSGKLLDYPMIYLSLYGRATITDLPLRAQHLLGEPPASVIV